VGRGKAAVLFETGEINQINNFFVACAQFCHARENGHPENKKKNWIPAFAGMTTKVKRAISRQA
jgi:hypothetical protein